jgi:hypothetical protein
MGLSLLHGFNCKGYCSPSPSTDLTKAKAPIPLFAKDKPDAGKICSGDRHAECDSGGMLLCRASVLRSVWVLPASGVLRATLPLLSYVARMLRMWTVRPVFERMPSAVLRNGSDSILRAVPQPLHPNVLSSMPQRANPNSRRYPAPGSRPVRTGLSASTGTRSAPAHGPSVTIAKGP